jgi:hypothetical protein
MPMGVETIIKYSHFSMKKFKSAQIMKVLFADVPGFRTTIDELKNK